MMAMTLSEVRTTLASWLGGSEACLDMRNVELLTQMLVAIDATLRQQGGRVDEVCEGCSGHGEVGGLTPQGYESQECPFCHGTGKEDALARPASSDRDVLEGAREDLLDWKGRALRAESRLRGLGYQGIDASEAPASSEPASREHHWDRDGERCTVCGDKGWMGGPCNGPHLPASEPATGEAVAWEIRETTLATGIAGPWQKATRDQYEYALLHPRATTYSVEARQLFDHPAEPVKVPDGYVLVPREPTPEMISACITVWQQRLKRKAETGTLLCGGNPEASFRENYAAMLDAAPAKGADFGEVTATDFATAMRECGLSLRTFAEVDQVARKIARARTAAAPGADGEVVA